MNTRKLTALMSLIIMALGLQPQLPADAQHYFGKMSLKTIAVGGLQREYYLYEPAGASGRALPTVLAFHGHGGSARGMDHFNGGLSSLADREGFLLVYPASIDRSWNDGRDIHQEPQRDDVAFVSELIDELVAKGLSDPQRIYATGISNGGFFSQYLALKLPGKFAAIASIAATLADPYLGLSSGEPVPVLYILGTDDPLVPWNGGKVGFKFGRGRGTAQSARKSVQFWCDNNGHAHISDSHKIGNRQDTDGTTVWETNYTAGNDCTDVALIAVQGGGHTLPGGIQYLPEVVIGQTCRQISANEKIWEFFADHQRHAVNFQ